MTRAARSSQAVKLPSILTGSRKLDALMVRPAGAASKEAPRKSVGIAARVFHPGFATSDPHRERAARLYERGDPERYIFEVFGWRLARDQRRAVQAYMDHPEVILVGANGTGKSALAHALPLGWMFDARGSVPLEDGSPTGGILLLIAPGGRQVKKAYQKHLVELGRRAAANGHILPGWERASKLSPNWVAVEGHWYIEGMTVGQESERDEVAHMALGAHHDNMAIIYDEVRAIRPSVIEAGRGRLRGAENRAIGSTNPTSAAGLGYKLSQVDGWVTVYSSMVGRLGYDTKGKGAVERLRPHENVEQRRQVIPGCTAHQRVEQDLRNRQHFEIRGKLFEGEGKPPEGYVKPDPVAGDFPYALPHPRLKDKEGPREDGFPGHPDADVLVIRPLTGAAYGRIVGGWPPMDPRSLFSDYQLMRAVTLREELPNPVGPPRCVGVDASTSERGDEMIGVAWWGPPVRELLQLAWGARENEEDSIHAGAENYLRMLKATQGGEGDRGGATSPGGEEASAPAVHVPAIVGEPKRLTVSESGAEAARELVDAYGKDTIYQVDPGGGHGVGSSLMAQGCTVVWMQFGAPALPALPGQDWQAFNARAMWALDLSLAVTLGLVGMCRDAQLREDLVAIGPPEEKSVGAGRGGKMTVMKIREKKEIKKYLGRSPDRGDAVKLASAVAPLERWE